eukprot:COSAG02_NODE_8290_length_2631_cov_1.917457_1_plen_343_part_00
MAEPPGTMPTLGAPDVEAPGSVSPPEHEPDPQVDEDVNAITAREPDARGHPPSKLAAAVSRAPTFSHARLKAITLSRGGANAVLIAGWEDIDDDGDDFMTKDTFRAVTTNLNIQWDVEAAWAQAQAIEEERAKREKVTADSRDGLLRVHKGDDQIHFTSYTSVFNVIMGAERRNHRLVVKLGFEKLVRDRNDDGHGLNKREISELVMSCKRRLLLLRPSFDIETDWELMEKRTTKVRATTSSLVQKVRLRSKSMTTKVTPKNPYDLPDDNEQSGEVPSVTDETQVEDLVDWDAFEQWWKLRMGLTETNVPVIPEYFSYKLKELSARKKHPDSQSPKIDCGGS